MLGDLERFGREIRVSKLPHGFCICVIAGLLPHPIFNPHQNNMVINGIPIPLNSSVFLSPDKNSMAELRFRTIQAQQNLVKNGLTSPRRFTTNAQMNTGATLSMPPPGLIPESLVRDILDLIKKEYPWAESLLASKMSKDQFKMFLDKLPELKNIITARMPVVPAASTPMLTGCPFSMHEVHAAAAMAAAAQSAREWERQNNKNPKRAPMKLFERLLQIKKVCEVGLLDEEILNEPLSPVTLSMILSMVNQVKVSLMILF